MTHLVDIRIDTRNMFAWARSIGIGSADLGYLVHSLVCAAYGNLRLQPFRHTEEGRTVRVLGYSAVPADVMRTERRAVAEPAVDCCFLSEMSKEMPDSWQVGSRYSFSVRVAPIVQYEGKQLDASFRAPEGSAREDVYLSWLERRMESGATIVQATMDSFSLERVARRGDAPDGTSRRKLGKAFTIPSVVVSGTLEVLDGDGFAYLIARGIGRHAAFGYGALMLRPSKAAIAA